MTTLAGLLFALALAQGAVAPGSIEGVVVSWGSAEPVGRAVVELRRSVPPGSRALFSSGGGVQASITLTTSEDGKFRLENVPPGEYRLYSTRANGYIPAEYGQRSPAGTGTALTLSEGQAVSGVRLAMAPTASIGGRILDRDGDPAVYGRVELLRTVYQDGSRILVIAQWALTDDHGDYRLHSLPPGEYYVSARPIQNRSTRGNAGITPIALASRSASLQNAAPPLVTRRVLDTGILIDETWMPIFFPGTTDLRSAQTLSLHIGENRQGIDISLAGSGVPVTRVRGVVIDGAAGSPVSGATVKLIPRNQLTPSTVMPNGDTDQYGRFDLQGVLPASYALLVSGPVTGFMILDVGTADVTDLKIIGSTGVDVPYRLTLEGNAISANADAMERRPRITLIREPVIPAEPSSGVGYAVGWPGLPGASVTPQSQAVPTGGFALLGVGLGDYRVKVSGLPQGMYVKSIRNGRIDIIREGFRVSGALENPLEIVLGNDGGTLKGRVVSDGKEPAANVTAVLVPNPTLRSRSDFYQSAATNENGNFRFESIAPGEYELFAWEEVPAGAWLDQDFMRTATGRGVSVTVRLGDNATNNGSFEVKVIPWNNVQ